MMTTILELLNNILIVTGSLGAIYSGWSWWQQRRRDRKLDQRITIRLCDQATRQPFHELKIRPPRRTITRAEVLGITGMVPTRPLGEGKEGKRHFRCAYSATQDFIDQIERVFDGDLDVIDLFFSAAEKDVFEFQPVASP